MGLLDQMKAVKVASGTGLITETGILNLNDEEFEEFVQRFEVLNPDATINLPAMEKGGVVPKTGKPVVRFAVKIPGDTFGKGSFTLYHNGKFVKVGNVAMP